MHKNTPNSPSVALNYTYDGTSDYLAKARLKMATVGCKPNYPLGAFCRFSELRRVELKEAFPKWPQQRIFQRIKQDWKKLENKQAYRDQAKQDYRDYKLLLEEWENNQAGQQPDGQRPAPARPAPGVQAASNQVREAQQYTMHQGGITDSAGIGNSETLQNLGGAESVAAKDPEATHGKKVTFSKAKDIQQQQVAKLRAGPILPKPDKDTECAAIALRRGSYPGVHHSSSSGLDLLAAQLQEQVKNLPEDQRLSLRPSPAPINQGRPLDIQISRRQRLPPASDSSRSIWTSEDDLALQRETMQLQGCLLETGTINRLQDDNIELLPPTGQTILNKGAKSCILSGSLEALNENSRFVCKIPLPESPNQPLPNSVAPQEPKVLGKRSAPCDISEIESSAKEAGP